jgi:LacI family transcriptional regulator
VASITIYDVAREAGVSMKTVSRVLNGEPHVREALRERVQKAVEALNYKPNPSARALASARTYLLGLYYNNPSPEYVSQIQYGVMQACRRAGYHLLVEELRTENVGAQVLDLQETVRTDGVILSPPVCDDPEVLAALDARGVPHVRIAPAPNQPNDCRPRVTIDDWRAAYEMTAYLQGLGHERIAFIAGPRDHAAAARRCDGYLAAMQREDGGGAQARVVSGDFSFRSGQEIGEALLGGEQRPTAIFASNDNMALGVMAAAQKLQAPVPAALSVAGFDDTPSAQVIWPQLTTVRQPITDMAAAAAEMLIGLASGQDVDLTQELAFSLVIRGSTGPVTSG